MKYPCLTIGDRIIGLDYKPIVLADIGINHGGSFSTALKMVDAAQRAGVEVVKHQTHIIEDEMSHAAKKVVPGNANISIYEIIKKCSLNQEQERNLKDYVESKGMIFISTPFSRSAADRLSDMDVPAFKIGSGECNNFPLIEHIASFRKPIILSTGMNDIPTIREATIILRKHKAPFALLHTTNLYPTPPHLVRLGALKQMQIAFPQVVTGLSDHTTSNHACFAAVALGASILERHFTDRRNRVGPDIVNSMDETEAAKLIEGTDLIWRMRGGEKKAVSEEQATIDFAFATVVSIRPIKKGELLTKENVWVKRPGVGDIPAKKFKDIIGKVAERDIPYDQHLSWKDVEK